MYSHLKFYQKLSIFHIYVLQKKNPPIFLFLFSQTLLDFENAIQLEKSILAGHSLFGYLKPVEMMN